MVGCTVSPGFDFAGVVPNPSHGAFAVTLELPEAAEVRLEVKRAYRILYRSQLNVAQALSRITRELKPYPEIQEFVEFVRSSERGIVR